MKILRSLICYIDLVNLNNNPDLILNINDKEKDYFIEVDTFDKKYLLLSK